MAGGAFVATFVVLAAFGDRLAPYRATALAGRSLQPPGSGHLLGTNLLGQDVFSQLLVGARVSVQVAVLAGVGSVLVGGIVGVVAGWFGGLTDAALMRFTDVVLVLPRLPLLLLVGALTGGSATSLGIVIALTFWPVTARVLRSQVLTLRTRTHVRAATGFGAGTWHQLRVHVLPDLALLAVAELIAAAARAVVLQAGLAFLGVGSVSRPSWGTMTRDAIGYRGLFVTPAWKWWLVPPVVAVVVLVMGIALLGTAAETRLSPRLARHAR
jgi:peptide/nickel transport system ATP-binding protein/peptide/nickel transport system permease protein